MNNQISLYGVQVRVDADGRYSLNDLHQAAIANKKATASDRPASFLRAAAIDKFVQIVTDAQKRASVVTAKGGVEQGSYAVEIVAMRYAAWIDPAFEVTVFEAFQNQAHGQHQIPSTYAEALRIAADQSETIEKQKLQLEHQKPAVEFHAAVTASADLISVGDFAKLKKWGRNKLFALMRKRGILQANNVPFQKYMERGYFSLAESTYLSRAGKEKIALTTMVTTKGQVWLVHGLNQLMQ